MRRCENFYFLTQRIKYFFSECIMPFAALKAQICSTIYFSVHNTNAGIPQFNKSNAETFLQQKAVFLMLK